MNGQNAVREARNGRQPIMVVIREQEGFRVYDASNPREVAHVDGTPQVPTCTCEEYQSNAREWGGCTHIDAVYRQTTQEDRKSTRLNSSHIQKSRMPSSA